MKVVLAKSTVDLLRRPATCVDTPPNISCGTSAADLAAREAVHLFAKRTHATGGLILLDRHGNPGFAYKHRPHGLRLRRPDGSFLTAVVAPGLQVFVAAGLEARPSLNLYS